MYKKEIGLFMLLRFSCKNFKSFYDEVNIDLTASAIKEHKDSLININNINILPVAAIFGANGSGKSNIFDALFVMRSEVYGNSSKEVRDAYITPFYFESSSRTSPSEFEICIYSEELKKEFRYGFSRNSKEVFEEWLFSKTFSKTPTVKEKLIYYRKKGEKIQLVGFGTFAVSHRSATTARNPRTGATINIPARKQAKFKAGKALQDSVN